MATNEWKQQLAGSGLEEEVAQAILALGFKRSSSFAHAFTNAEALEAWLSRLQAKVPSASSLSAEEWRTSPACGDLRAFWKCLAKESVGAPVGRARTAGSVGVAVFHGVSS